jgi:hypothetical protein
MNLGCHVCVFRGAAREFTFVDGTERFSTSRVMYPVWVASGVGP